jgi:predicted  nucleic acid-binding Zn-ribbon protein
MSKFKDYLSVIIAFAAVVGLVLGAINYFAKAEDLQLVELRLDQKIMSDQVMQIQQRIWQLEDRYKGRPCSEWSDQADRDEYRKLQMRVDELKKRQDKMMRK